MTNSSPTLAFLLLSLLSMLGPVHGGLYVNHPLPTDTCSGGSSCNVQWLDDGQYPLLSDIGLTTVGLYHGEQSIVQTIAPVDVAQVHSLDFNPAPNAGPNSGDYYICFTSVTLRDPANASWPYRAYSPHFSINSMTGSFASPVASLTSTLPIPSTVASPPPNSISTSTVGSAPTTTSTSTLTSMSMSSATRSQSSTGSVTRPSSTAPSAAPSSSTTPNSALSHLPALLPLFVALPVVCLL